MKRVHITHSEIIMIKCRQAFKECHPLWKNYGCQAESIITLEESRKVGLFNRNARGSANREDMTIWKKKKNRKKNLYDRHSLTANFPVPLVGPVSDPLLFLSVQNFGTDRNKRSTKRRRPNAEATPKKARLRTPIRKDCFNITLDTNNHMSLGIGFPKVIQKWLEVDVLGIGRVGDGRLHFESLYDCINAIEENHEIPERLQTILRDIWIDGNRLRHKESNFLSDPRGYWQKAIEILSFLYPNASIVHEPNLKERRQEERIQELEQKLRRWDQRIEELQQLLADPRGSRDHHGRRSSGGYHGSYSPRCDYNDGNDQCCSIRYRDDVNDHHSHSRSRSPKRSRRRS